MAKVRINAAVLQWAVADAGASTAQLARATKRDVATVQQWLQGQAQPNKGDLEAVASVVGRSPQFFFLASPPERSSARVNRRTALIDSEDVSQPELQTFREIERLQKISRWLVERVGSAKVEFPPLVNSPAVYADRVRSWLNWSFTNQRTASSKSAAFRALRRTVEDAGVFVFMRQIGDESTSPGFALTDTAAPTIFINSAFALGSVRSFTLMHELAHLARKEGRLHHNYDREEERWCEQFAAAFLIPESDLRTYLSKGKVSQLSLDDVNRVRLAANYFKVSWHAAAIRIVELGLGPRTLIDAATEEPPEEGRPGPEAPVRSTPVVRHEEFGTEFPRLVLAGLERDRLTTLDARKYLRVNEAQLQSLAGLVAS